MWLTSSYFKIVYTSNTTINSNSIISVLRDTDITAISPQYTLSAPQNHAFQYIDSLISTMEPITNEETENDIEDIEVSIVSFFMYSILNCIPFNIFT